MYEIVVHNTVTGATEHLPLTAELLHDLPKTEKAARAADEKERQAKLDAKAKAASKQAAKTDEDTVE